MGHRVAPRRRAPRSPPMPAFGRRAVTSAGACYGKLAARLARSMPLLSSSWERSISTTASAVRRFADRVGRAATTGAVDVPREGANQPREALYEQIPLSGCWSGRGGRRRPGNGAAWSTTSSTREVVEEGTPPKSSPLRRRASRRSSRNSASAARGAGKGRRRVSSRLWLATFGQAGRVRRSSRPSTISGMQRRWWNDVRDAYEESPQLGRACCSRSAKASGTQSLTACRRRGSALRDEQRRRKPKKSASRAR